MKKILVILFLIPFLSFSQGSIIFSEYGEGSSFNKWIEIYNPTSQDVLLDDYRYNFCWNGCDNLSWEFSIAFDTGHIILSGETYLLTHYDASSNLLNAADQTTNLMSNGNDVAALFHIPTNTIVDIIGVFDSTDVGDGWDVDGVINATEDHTMIRKPSVCVGNMGDWSISDGSSIASEWSVGIIEDYTNIKLHTSDCFSSSSIAEQESIKGNVIMVTDLLGRESKQTRQSNRLLIYTYDNGTVEKKMSID